MRQLLLIQDATIGPEVDRYLPGGSENSEPPESIGAWIYAYGNLGRFLGRAEGREVARTAPETNAAAEAAALAALRRQPAEVELLATDAEGRGLRCRVYPKAYVPLSILHQVHEQIGWLTREIALLRRALAEGAQAAEQLDLLRRARAELAYQYRLAAWIATTPGHGLPFGEEDDAPVLPNDPVLLGLDVADFYRISVASREVNAERLALLDVAEGSDDANGAASRPSFATYFTLTAEQRHTTAAALMRDVTLAELFAASRVSANAYHEARRRAGVEREGDVVEDAQNTLGQASSPHAPYVPPSPRAATPGGAAGPAVLTEEG